MRTYQIVGTVTGTTDGVAYVEMRAAGVICGIDWSIDTGGTLAAGDLVRCQVALNNTTQQTGNDATNVLCHGAAGGSLLTSGAVNASVQKWCGPMAVPVRAGDRIYLHATESGGLTWNIRIVLHVK